MGLLEHVMAQAKIFMSRKIHSSTSEVFLGFLALPMETWHMGHHSKALVCRVFGLARIRTVPDFDSPTKNRWSNSATRMFAPDLGLDVVEQMASVVGLKYVNVPYS